MEPNSYGSNAGFFSSGAARTPPRFAEWLVTMPPGFPLLTRKEYVESGVLSGFVWLDMVFLNKCQEGQAPPNHFEPLPDWH